MVNNNITASYQSIVKIQDKSIIKCNDDETRVVEPISIQKIIDEKITKYKNGRSFVRPSGTENAVRVYAEASTKEEAIELSKEIMKATYDNANGIDNLDYSLLK